MPTRKKTEKDLLWLRWLRTIVWLHKDFLKTLIQYFKLDKIKPLLLSDYFYSCGIASDTDTGDIICIKTNFDKENIDRFRFCCQRIILKNVSDELHQITSMSWFFIVKKKMKFEVEDENEVCCCLFDYCIYKFSTKTTFSFTCHVYGSKDVGYTFISSIINYFIHACYSCV